MEKQQLDDLQTLINAINLAQSRGAFRLAESEALAKNVRNIVTYVTEQKKTE